MFGQTRSAYPNELNQKYFCTLCNMSLNGLAQWNDYHVGQKHRLRAAGGNVPEELVAKGGTGGGKGCGPRYPRRALALPTLMSTEQEW